MPSTFSELEYSAKKKLTRRDRFLAEVEALTPWSYLLEALAPCYPKDERGRPPIGLERMLRLYVLQQCFGLSDVGAEDALCDSQAIRRFVGIDLAREAAPYATMLLKEGTIVDATIIAAPPSVKNKKKERDPDMHRAKKDNQWHFGVKAHHGVDAETGVVHTVFATAANVGDVTQTHALLHGEEKAVYGDASYSGVDKREENRVTSMTWHGAMKPGKRKIPPDSPLGKLLKDQYEHPCEGRAPVPYREEPLQAQQDATVIWRRTRRSCTRC